MVFDDDMTFLSGQFRELETSKLVPGKYICIPHGTLLALECGSFPALKEQAEKHDEGIWIVNVFEDRSLICYTHPDTKEDYVCETCDHKFYGPIN